MEKKRLICVFVNLSQVSMMIHADLDIVIVRFRRHNLTNVCPAEECRGPRNEAFPRIVVGCVRVGFVELVRHRILHSSLSNLNVDVLRFSVMILSQFALFNSNLNPVTCPQSATSVKSSFIRDRVFESL